MDILHSGTLLTDIFTSYLKKKPDQIVIWITIRRIAVNMLKLLTSDTYMYSGSVYSS